MSGEGHLYTRNKESKLSFMEVHSSSLLQGCGPSLKPATQFVLKVSYNVEISSKTIVVYLARDSSIANRDLCKKNLNISSLEAYHIHII